MARLWWRDKFFFILHLASCILNLASPLRSASLQDAGFGARQTSLGGAVAAGGAEGVYGIYYNPAQIALAPHPELTLDFAQLLLGLSDDSRLFQQFIGASYPWRNIPGSQKALGFAYSQYALEAPELGELFSEKILFLSYAQALRQRFLNGRAAAGLTIKNINRGYGAPGGGLAYDNAGNVISGQDPIMRHYKTTAQALSLDLGLNWRHVSGFAWGLHLSDINRPDFALIGGDQKLAAGVNFGIALAAPRYRRFVAGLDIKERLASVLDRRYLFGLEQGIPSADFGLFSLRGSFAEGSRSFRQIGFGLSWQIFALSLDYSFTLPLGSILSITGNHRVTFSVFFGGVSPEERLFAAYQKEKEARLGAERELAKALADIEMLIKMQEGAPALESEEEEKQEKEKFVALERVYAHPDDLKPETPRPTPAQIERERRYNRAWTLYQERRQLAWNPQLKLDSTQNLGILPSQKSSTVPPARSHFFVSSKYPSFESRSNAPTGDSRLAQVTREELLEILTQMSETFGHDAKIEQEMTGLLDALNKDRANFARLWQAYQRLINAGADPAVLSRTANRILNQFKGTGVPLREVERELQRLRALGP